MGGEWGIGAALSMETVPPRWRGIVSGFLQQGYPTGYLLAAFCYRLLPPDWSWRSLFFIGGLPALLAIFVRMRVKESAVWQQGRRHDWSHLTGAIAAHWKSFLYLVLLMTVMNLSSHGTQDLYPSFLEKQRHLTKPQVANVAIIYNIGAIFGGATFGLLSDFRGRRRAMSIAFALAACLIPLWISGASIPALALGSFLMQFMIQGCLGQSFPAHITEPRSRFRPRIPSRLRLPMRRPTRRQFRPASKLDSPGTANTPPPWPSSHSSFAVLDFSSSFSAPNAAPLSSQPEKSKQMYNMIQAQNFVLPKTKFGQTIANKRVRIAEFPQNRRFAAFNIYEVAPGPKINIYKWNTVHSGLPPFISFMLQCPSHGQLRP